MGQSIAFALFQPPAFNGRKPDIEIPTRSGINTYGTFINTGSNTTILFSHGNAEDLSYFTNYFKGFSKSLKVNILLYEYFGYGATQIHKISPSEAGVIDCAEAAMNYLLKNNIAKESDIILYGRSLGSHPTLVLANRYPNVKGIVLQGALLSAYRIAGNWRYTLPGDQFDNLNLVEYIKPPTLLIHGGSDEVVPFWHSKEIYAKLKDPCSPLWISEAHHNDIESEYYDSDCAPMSLDCSMAVAPAPNFTANILFSFIEFIIVSSCNAYLNWV